MEKTFDNTVDELIDLGSATEETRGSALGIDDTLGGRKVGAGLTND